MLLVLVAVVGHKAGVDLAHLGDEAAPQVRLAVGADHLAPGAVELGAHVLRDARQVDVEVRIGAEPILPLRLAGDVGVKEIDVGAPIAVPAVDHGLEDDLLAQLPRDRDARADVLLAHDVVRGPVDLGGIGVVLQGRHRQEQRIAARARKHPAQGIQALRVLREPLGRHEAERRCGKEIH